MMRDDPAAAAASVSQGREVLPKNVKPKHYNLTLEPDLDKHEYSGTVQIECVYSPGLSMHTLIA